MFGIKIERDSFQENLESDVFSKIKDIRGVEDDIPKDNLNIRKVSVEEAIKELLELEKGINNRDE
jgi:hypothetical protein